jgi:succinate-acetate transporter protein
MTLPGFIQNRATLLLIIGLITTFSALGPFLIEEVTCTVIGQQEGEHTDYELNCFEMVAHEILHISAITFGIFLTILSIIAYNSTRNTNMIFTALAFITFTLLSIFLLEEDLNAERLHHAEDGNVVAVWVDVLLTIMIGFFGIGVFLNQKFPNRIKYD